jgi:hypothetical protein
MRSSVDASRVASNIIRPLMKRKPVPVLWMGVGFGVALALAVAVFAVTGVDSENLRIALRLTARWSFLLFWLAYAGGAMAKLAEPNLAALAHRGREFGLAFAAAHLVHVGLVAWLYWVLGHAPLGGLLGVFFTIGIAWTYLLAVLSFGFLSQAVGPKIWYMLRFVGMNYILLAFARDFVLEVTQFGIGVQAFWRWVGYVPFAAMCIAAPLLCLAAAAHRRVGARIDQRLCC